MPTLTEESADYAEKVDAYLSKARSRRLPWGSVVYGGHLTQTKSTREIAERREVGEVAIALLNALGISDEVLASLADLPWNVSGEALVARLEELRAAPAPAAESSEQTEGA